MIKKKQSSSNKSTSDESMQVRFHGRNTLAFFLVFLGVITGFLMLMMVQHNKSKKLVHNSLKRHFMEQAVHLDSLLKQVTNHLSDMRQVAQADLMETRSNPPLKQPASFDFIQNSNNFFHMDNLSPPFTKQMIGNLTGDGSIENRNMDFYREIHLALNLNPLFMSARESIKTAAWVYYISAKEFINLYPWVASDQWKFGRQSFDKEFFTLGLPENNPHGKPFWTQVYVDEVGIGLMTSCGTPIYDENRFVGVIALDLTVDFLNTVVSKFHSDHGEMFLVNNKNQLVAHPKLTSSRDKAIQHISKAIPLPLQPLILELDKKPDAEIHESEGYLILKTHLENAPWQVLYIEPVPSIVTSFVKNVGLNIIIFICGLLILVAIILAITQFTFVVPAEKFVRFILARNQGKDSKLDKQVPKMWRPWFHVVDNTFRTNEALTKKMKNNSALLEQRVKERTLELHESEEKMRNILENSTNLFYSHTANHEIIYVSPQCQEFLQCEPEEAMIRWTEFATDNPINEKGYELTNTAIETGKRQQPYELEIRGKKGKVIIVEVREAPIVKNGKTVSMVGSLTDITERKKAEKEKAILQSQLIQVQKMKSIGTLAGGIAHEFNNILGIILGNAEIAMDDIPRGNPAQESLSEILTATLRGKDVVKQLLSFSRKRSPHTKLIDLVKIAKESIGFLRASIPTSIQFKENIFENSLPIMANPDQIHQLIINLYNNAAQAMEEQGGTLEITLKNITVNEPLISYDMILEPGEYVQLAISDTGQGIPGQIIERVFDPFFTTKDVDKGSGMGLAVVHGIIKGHNGFIKIESSPNKGATVLCYFPKMEDAHLPAKDVKSAKSLPSGVENILFVDDETSLIKMVRLQLERLGYQVETQNNPIEALQFFRSNCHKIHLVITDMTMPQMTGDQFITELQKIKPDIKTIICTGYSIKMNHEKAAKIGANGYIMKPIERKMLAEIVRKTLDNDKFPATHES